MKSNYCREGFRLSVALALVISSVSVVLYLFVSGGARVVAGGTQVVDVPDGVACWQAHVAGAEDGKLFVKCDNGKLFKIKGMAHTVFVGHEMP